MTSLAGSGFKMEEDHLNIKIVVRSVCYNAGTLRTCGNMWLNKNKLKIHPLDGNIKKLIQNGGKSWKFALVPKKNYECSEKKSGGWMGVKAVLRITYSNQKSTFFNDKSASNVWWMINQVGVEEYSRLDISLEKFT